MYTVNDIANWFLKNINGITNKKLQKLVYYAYSWFLVFNNESKEDIEVRLFENKFEAWVHGAVHSELYHQYKHYGSAQIDPYAGELADFSEDELDILNQVKDVYGDYNGNELESICHQESPWKNARAGLSDEMPSHNPILDKWIFECYFERII